MSLQVKIVTFLKYLETGIAPREEKIRLLQGKHCSHSPGLLFLGCYGLPREQRHCAGTSRYLCKCIPRTRVGLKIINIGGC